MHGNLLLLKESFLQKNIENCFSKVFVYKMSKSNAKVGKMKGLVRSSFLLIALTLLRLQTGQSQNVEALSVINTDSILIGQQLIYELQMKVPKGFQVNWPTFGDTLTASLEIVQQSVAEQFPLENDDQMVWRQQLVLTSFDTGFVYIPAISIDFAPEGDTVFYEAKSNPLLLRVFSVAVDTTVAFKAIKGIEEMPLTFAEVFPWVIAILAIALLLFLLVWWYMRQRNKPITLAPIAKPQVPPHLIAIEKLEELRLQKLWQNGKVKEYYTALSDIIREYIELQFPVNAIEMTTHEILEGLQTVKINEEAMYKLSVTLELADLVKFAKAHPSALENDISLNHLIDFVKESFASLERNEMIEKPKEDCI